MRILSLKIKNFKNISEISVTKLPNLVVLVGENGVGKSSIFEAISFVKTMNGPYYLNEVELWKERATTFIRAGRRKMHIEIECEPTNDDEKKLMQYKSESASISLDLDDKQSPWKNNCGKGLQQIFVQGWKYSSMIGWLEYIPANRTFPEGGLGFSYYMPGGEDFLSKRISNIQYKFQDAKMQFVSLYFRDLIVRKPPYIFQPLKKLMEVLLESKIKLKFNEINLQPEILMKSDSGYVNIDSLSSGQKELFYTYVGIHTLSAKHSIILFDEPDLHLHASLQDKIIKYLQGVVSRENQVFIATHSVEMIASTPEENLFHLSRHKGNTQLRNLEKEKDKVTIFEKLGASRYTFVNFKKVVFVEGDSDYSILNQSTRKYSLRYHPIGGISNIAPNILEQASEIESFFMIRDRDFHTDDQIREIKQKYKNKIHVLGRRQIENYILDDEALFEVVDKIMKNQFKDKSDLVAKLFDISREQLEKTIFDCYISRHGKDTNPKLDLNFGLSAEAGLSQYLNTRSKRIATDIKEIPKNISSIRNELNKKWIKNWLIYSDGKEVLKRFVNVTKCKKSFEDVRDMVSLVWDTKGNLPTDLENIVSDIANSKS